MNCACMRGCAEHGIMSTDNSAGIVAEKSGPLIQYFPHPSAPLAVPPPAQQRTMDNDCPPTDSSKYAEVCGVV